MEWEIPLRSMLGALSRSRLHLQLLRPLSKVAAMPPKKRSAPAVPEVPEAGDDGPSSSAATTPKKKMKKLITTTSVEVTKELQGKVWRGARWWEGRLPHGHACMATWIRTRL